MNLMSYSSFAGSPLVVSRMPQSPPTGERDMLDRGWAWNNSGSQPPCWIYASIIKEILPKELDAVHSRKSSFPLSHK